MEPFKRAGVLAYPDEFDTFESARWIRACAQVPDVFENTGPWCYANASTNEDCDFVVEDVLCGSTIGSVDAESGHLLTVLKSDFVHAHRVKGIVFFCLGGPGAKGVPERFSEVADLADMDADIWVVGAGGDGEWVPLRAAYGGDFEEKPLAGFVFHVGLGKLNLQCIVRVTDDFGDFRWSSRLDGAVDAFNEIDSPTKELPSPAFVADAMSPEILACKRRERLRSVSYETARGVGVHGKEERYEEVVGVVEGLK